MRSRNEARSLFSLPGSSQQGRWRELGLAHPLSSAEEPPCRCHEEAGWDRRFISDPESQHIKQSTCDKPPYLLLKYLGQGGTVCQLNEPHHVGDRPLQRVALQNQPLLLLLFRVLQRKGRRSSAVAQSAGWVLSRLQPFLAGSHCLPLLPHWAPEKAAHPLSPWESS